MGGQSCIFQKSMRRENKFSVLYAGKRAATIVGASSNAHSAAAEPYR